MADRLEDLLRACTVRVIRGPVSGAGFFVAPGKVLTCVHVIKDCDDLRVIEDTADPVVRWERDGQPALEAKWCRPIAVLADRGRSILALKCPYPDIAVLEIGGLEDHPCVGIDRDWPSLEDSFLVFGYPEEGGAVHLTPASLTYRGTHGTSPTAYLDLASDMIKPGMSGAAVLNLRSGAVCGVVVASKHPDRPDGALAIPWSAIETHLADVLAANRAFHRQDRRWRWEEAARAAPRRFHEMAPVLTATAKWERSLPLMDAPYVLKATVRNGSDWDYKVSGKCRPANRSESFKEISFTLPALGTSEIKLGHYKRGGRGGPETFQVYEAVFLVLETIEGIGSWKRAFQVSPTLLDRQSQRRKPVPMMVIPYDPPGHITEVRVTGSGLDEVIVDAETIEAIRQLALPDPGVKLDGGEPITLGEALDTIEARIRRRLDATHNHPVYVALSERLERLRHRQLTQAAASVDFLRELLELAQQVTAVERADDEGHLDEVSILPDPNVGALTQIFREYAPPDSPVIIENVVNDIDTIVRQVRFTGWSQTQNGDRTVRREVRLTLNKYGLPTTGELFDRAYAYIRENY